MLRALSRVASAASGAQLPRAARWAAAAAPRLPPLGQPAAFRRALSDVPLLPHESRVLRQMREAKDGVPLAHVPGSPFGGDVIIKRLDRFGRRRIKGKRGMSKRVIWAKQVAKSFYYNLSTKKLHRIVRTAIRAKQGFTQALYFQLESRLDMFLRRCFFAPSLASARQAISHKFVLVNGRTAVSASRQLDYGDVVQVDEKALAKMRRTLLAVRRRACAAAATPFAPYCRARPHRPALPRVRDRPLAPPTRPGACRAWRAAGGAARRGTSATSGSRTGACRSRRSGRTCTPSSSASLARSGRRGRGRRGDEARRKAGSDQTRAALTAARS